MSRILFVVSARLPAPTGQSPRKDYSVLADAFGANILDYSAIDHSVVARGLRRILGIPVAQAWMAFTMRRDCAAIVTDGEHIGLPLAALLKLSGSRTPHVTIGHRLTAAKKRPLFRWLKLHSHISRVAVHAQRQLELGHTELGIPAEQLALVPYQVDTDFWQPPADAPREALIASAGLEFRDYPTLFQAVEGLDVRVVVGAASHWSRRRSTADGSERFTNVEVASFDYAALRDLYARAAMVVVPLADVDFQAGVTTILEAMSMGKPVIVTHSLGQTDVVEDRRRITRGQTPRSRSSSFSELLSAELDGPVEQTGFYVPPSDPQALRRAIVYLLENPEERARLGAAARRTVQRLYTVEQFGQRMRRLVQDAIASPDLASTSNITTQAAPPPSVRPTRGVLSSLSRIFSSRARVVRARSAE